MSAAIGRAGLAGMDLGDLGAETLLGEGQGGAERPIHVDDLPRVHYRELHPTKEQPRAWFDAKAITDLAALIRKNGLDPIQVRPRREGGFYIYNGERRYYAVRYLVEHMDLEEFAEVPILLQSQEARSTVSFRDLARMYAEDVGKEKRTPLENAMALAALIQRNAAESGEELSAQDLADRLGEDPRKVQRYVRIGSSLTAEDAEILLGELAPSVKDPAQTRSRTGGWPTVPASTLEAVVSWIEEQERGLGEPLEPELRRRVLATLVQKKPATKSVGTTLAPLRPAARPAAARGRARRHFQYQVSTDQVRGTFRIPKQRLTAENLSDLVEQIDAFRAEVTALKEAISSS